MNQNMTTLPIHKPAYVADFNTAMCLSINNGGERFRVLYPDRESRAAAVRKVTIGFSMATGHGFLISCPDGLCLTVYGFTGGRCTSAVELWVR